MAHEGDSRDAEVDELRALMTRLVRELVSDEQQAARRGEDLMPILDAHLGVPADQLPVVVESIAVHRWADTDIALSAIVERDPGARLIGVGGGDQRHHNSLSDLMSQAEWGRFRTGQVDRLNVPTGPDAERATVAFGLHLFHHAGRPVVALQRVGNPQYGSDSRLEVLTVEPGTATALLAELREEAMRRSVLWRQVIGFRGNPYERSMSGLTFHRRPDVPSTSCCPTARSRRCVPTWSAWRHTATSSAAGDSTSSGASCSTARPAPARRTRSGTSSVRPRRPRSCC